MENITGFIVRVKPLGRKPTHYYYNGSETILDIGDEFIGYFWQMTEKDEVGKFHKAHIRKVIMIDSEKLLFRYVGEAAFDLEAVSITILAKRGPKSNNLHLPEEFDQYDTWNIL